jgi:putative RNA 2'-phosphotransferase
MKSDQVRLSKFLSLVLRHQPEAIGLTLDENGWASVDELLRLANEKGTRIDRPLLEQIVADNDKKRFALSDDGQRIRATQLKSNLPFHRRNRLICFTTAPQPVRSNRSA